MKTSLGKPLAVGRTAEIYPWQDGQILKLFFDWHPPQSIAYEQRIGQTIYASGMAVPAVGDMIWVEGRCGLVYQRVEGRSLLEKLAHHPFRVIIYAQQTADLHAVVHSHPPPQAIPAQRQRLTEKLHNAPNLSGPLREQALVALGKLPPGDSLCHGDFHPGNILLHHKTPMIIDWVDASWGNPLADVARTSILLLGAAHCQVKGMQAFFVRLFHVVYLRRYLGHRPEAEAEYRRWLPIVAAARLSEQIRELEGWLTARAAEGLSNCPKLDFIQIAPRG